MSKDFMSETVAIIGSHGIYASYGGWDQLVVNLVERSSKNIHYIVVNPRETKISNHLPPRCDVKKIFLSASGVQGLFFDFISIALTWRRSTVLLLLGAQGIPLAFLLNLFSKRKRRIVVNIGGIEWERPKFGFFAKTYLRFTSYVASRYANHLIIDNEHYRTFFKNEPNIVQVPYGGHIDRTIDIDQKLCDIYPFLGQKYCLSISRSLEDNNLVELCDYFSNAQDQLVLVSNFSKTAYGKSILNKYSNCVNITLIDGLYEKPVLDLIRRHCALYIHTHTLCGTAPSLVEMIACQVPIASIDVPQNRFTLKNQGFFFQNFDQLNILLNDLSQADKFIPSSELVKEYSWATVVHKYEELYL